MGPGSCLGTALRTPVLAGVCGVFWCAAHALPDADSGLRIEDLAKIAEGWRGEVIAEVDQSYAGWDVEIGDADNDGANEVLVVGCPDSRLYLFEKADGAWRRRLLAERLARRTPGMGLAVRVVDLDRDGRNEVVVGTGQEAAEPAFLYVFQTDGTRITREITARAFLDGSAFTHNLAFHDLDGDGLLEIVTAYCGSGEVTRFDVRPGLAGIDRRKIYHLSGSGEDCCLSDVDNDGTVELILCNSYREDQGRVEILEFRPDGELVIPPRVTIDGFDGQKCFDCAVEVGDLDGDGRRELIVGWNRKQGIAKGTVLGYRVEPEGGARRLWTFALEDDRLDLGYFEKMMCIADADNDGRNELVVSTRGERQWGGRGLGHVFLYRLGAGGEVSETLLADFHDGRVESSWIAVGDADGDEKNEVVIATGGGPRDRPGRSYVVSIEPMDTSTSP